MNAKEFLDKILEEAWKRKYSDIHLNTGSKPIIRDESWNINIFSESYPTLTKECILELVNILVWSEWKSKFLEEYECDSSYQYQNGSRYRINCYMDTKWYSIALRFIPDSIPSLEELWLWEQIKSLCDRSKWLILVTGPTGSWKSTNLAAMIDYINRNHSKHIITIEDPVEFSFQSKKSLLNQREVWNSTHSFERAMKSVLREDPDIIMIWEMRDPETIKAAITLAETWHLVLSTLHTNDSVQTLDRIIDVFPWNQQAQIRMQLAQSLAWVVSQRLLPRADNSWRIAAREILIANDAIRNLIISWKTHQLYSVLEVGHKSGMILMDKYLIALYNKGIIDKSTLQSYARDKENIEMLID